MMEFSGITVGEDCIGSVGERSFFRYEYFSEMTAEVDMLMLPCPSILTFSIVQLVL